VPSDFQSIEAALSKATRAQSDLSPDERAAIREVLEWWRTWKAMGKIGKAVLWLMITAGAVAAAAREVGAWLRG
jgi:hypothetical protein